MDDSRSPVAGGVSDPSAHEPPTPVSTAVWTVPNLISLARIGLIAVFGALLVAGHEVWAIVALVAAGLSDFLDGYLARRWNQVTALGRLLDPAADRLLTVVVVLALGARGAIPWWLVAVLLGRDAMVAIALVIGRSRGVPAPRVTFAGKSATAALYVSLPLAFLAHDRWDTIHVVAIMGACAAAALYWASGVTYLRALTDSPGTGAPRGAVETGGERLG